jgi:hypothetical protein
LRIWADALCISQDDVPERNHQVQLMGSIYPTSVHTVIYLGSFSPEIDIDFEQINEVTSNETYYQADFVQHLMLEQPEILTTAAKQLISRPWFTRIWILQELVLARDPLGPMWLQEN